MKKIFPVFFLSISLLLIMGNGELLWASKYWDFPPLPSPYQYGNILINRVSEKNNVKPVSFSHWSHRINFTCRVCHFELGFAFDVNKTEITEEDNRNGLFCGTCHNGKTAYNGKTAFPHTEEYCDRCHTGTVDVGREKFADLTETLPKELFGNKIDWGKAIGEKYITPLYSIFREKEKPLPFDKLLWLEATWNFIPPAYFPHKEHIQWLDCANCHPDIFNIRKKTTKSFAMQYILEKKFCGVCHLKVAFPLDDCNGCHPKISREKN